MVFDSSCGFWNVHLVLLHHVEDMVESITKLRSDARLLCKMDHIFLLTSGPDTTQFAYYFFSPLLILLPIAFVFPIIGVTLCLYKCHWFLIEFDFIDWFIKLSNLPQNVRIQVIVVPSPTVRLSLKISSRLDLGKEKYGGPFTTEELG